ncbi:MAG: alpha/beta hydrolase family protein [Solirubrobacteraceae bacterium]
MRTPTVLLVILCCCVAGCGSATTHRTAHTPLAWIDQPVSFEAGGLRIDATYRHPIRSGGLVPAVLLIAGSGPTDRNGNAPGGRFGTLQALADWLSTDGVATLRYDKLASGQTGLGRYAADPARIGIAPFEQEAAAALRFLAARPGVKRDRLAVIGHSEGALFALLLADGDAGQVPPVRGLGLLAPLSERYLDVIATQFRDQIAAAVRAGRLSSARALALVETVNRTVVGLRQSGTVYRGLPAPLRTSIAGAPVFLRQADRHDPATLASQLPAGTSVLVSCSDADIQVSCGEVEHLVGSIRAGRARLDFVRLRGVDHILKQDGSRTSASYTTPLPYSPQLRAALRAFVHSTL